jgi:hypothetical protein
MENNEVKIDMLTRGYELEERGDLEDKALLLVLDDRWLECRDDSLPSQVMSGGYHQLDVPRRRHS